MIDVFQQFWWLMFPMMFMLIGLAKAIGYSSRRNRVLKLIETYVAQGKEPPAALLDSLKH